MRIVDELSSTRNLMYVSITIALVSIATTVYFARRKPKTIQHPSFSNSQVCNKPETENSGKKNTIFNEKKSATPRSCSTLRASVKPD
jgi:hypothetical protein